MSSVLEFYLAFFPPQFCLWALGGFILPAVLVRFIRWQRGQTAGKWLGLGLIGLGFLGLIWWFAGVEAGEFGVIYLWAALMVAGLQTAVFLSLHKDPGATPPAPE